MKIRLKDIAAINQAIKNFSEDGRLDIRQVLYERRYIEVFMPSNLADSSLHQFNGSELHAEKQIQNAMITLDSHGNVVVDFPESLPDYDKQDKEKVKQSNHDSMINNIIESTGGEI